MQRREVLKAIVLASAAERLCYAAESPVPASARTPELADYEKLRFGVSFHFNLNTFTGNDYEPGNVPASAYNPTRLDVRQWIRVTHEAGAKYAVLTAKHMSGFCLWPSKASPYNVASSGNATDVVGAFVEACTEYGVRPGAYYCILDPHNEGKLDWKAEVSQAYFQLIRQHVTELHTRYPKLFYQFFDIPAKLTPAQRWELYRLVKKLNPTCLVVMNQCLGASRQNQARKLEAAAWPTDIVNAEDTLPPETGHDPRLEFDGRPYYVPMESWMTSGPFYDNKPNLHAWFWRPGYVTQPAEQLFGIYRACVARRSNLLLNLAPNTEGGLPQETVVQLGKLKQLIART